MPTKIIKEFFKVLIIVVICIGILFPLYYLLLMAFKPTVDIDKGDTSLIIKNPTIYNFQTVLKYGFWSALGLTLLAILTILILRIVVYSLAIAGLIKLQKKHIQNAVIYLLIFISLVPEFVLYLALKTNLNVWKMSGAHWFSLVTNSLFSFFIFTYTFKIALNVSQTKGRLAINDNLRWYEKVFYVYLPDLKLSYLLLIIFSTTQVWNEYLWPIYLLNNTSAQNISLWFSSPPTDFYVTQNIVAAGSFIATVIPLITYLAFSKWINRATR